MISPRHEPPDNLQIARTLDETAELLESQGANPFRVKAYRKAAQTARDWPQPLHQIVATDGSDGLLALPGFGRSLAYAVAHLVEAGRLSLLERLRGENAPERIFATVPDIGPELAHRIHTELGIESLVELQAAANDGRLERVPGIGAKRLRAVREALAGRFARREQAESPRRPSSTLETLGVPVGELLDVDEEYRRLAKQGKLPRIAPRRFNPTHESWLPVLHTVRNEHHYTALYSNTARAHELGTTHDWVVIYRDDDGDHGRWTVITSQFGPLRNQRIVRGREQECAAYYAERQRS